MASAATKKLPSYDLNLVESYRQQLKDHAFFEFAGDVAAGESFDRLVYLITQAVPRLPEKAVRESIRNIAGEPLTEPLISQTCWRLAGNVQRLRRGLMVPPWHVQQDAEWVPVQVLSYTRERRKHRWLSQYRLRALAGTPCPCVIVKSWADSFARVVAGRLGYSPPWGKHPLRDLSELVNLRFYALVEPDQCAPGRPGFERLVCSQSMLEWNRRLIKMRRRVDFQCPRGFEHECFQCHVGYRDCEPAVRRLTESPPTKETEDAQASPD